jgi:hypothetical protein
MAAPTGFTIVEPTPAITRLELDALPSTGIRITPHEEFLRIDAEIPLMILVFEEFAVSDFETI